MGDFKHVNISLIPFDRETMFPLYNKVCFPIYVNDQVNRYSGWRPPEFLLKVQCGTVKSWSSKLSQVGSRILTKQEFSWYIVGGITSLGGIFSWVPGIGLVCITHSKTDKIFSMLSVLLVTDIEAQQAVCINVSVRITMILFFCAFNFIAMNVLVLS